MLSAAKHLAAQRGRPFAALRVTNERRSCLLNFIIASYKRRKDTMPLVECYLNEMTDELALKLEREITASIREAVAKAFPPELGYKPGTIEYQVGLEVSRKIMPGWTWVSVSQLKWAAQG